MNRIETIDAYRGFAILLMFLHHFPLKLLQEKTHSLMYGFFVVVSRLAAPMFLFTVGVCLGLSRENRMKEGVKNFITHLLERTIVLFATGWVLNEISPQPDFGYILYAIGFSILFTIPVLVTEKRMYKILFLGLALSTSLNTQLLESSFPAGVAAWSSFTLAGLIFKEHVKSRKHSYNSMLAAGAGVAALALLSMKLGVGVNPWPPSLPYIWFMLGLNTITYTIFDEHGERLASAWQVLKAYGRHAYILYAGHVLILAAAGLWIGEAMDELSTIAVLLVFIGSAYALIESFEKRKTTASI